MISLEQVKLLETKVSRTIDFVKKVTGENSALKEKLDSYQKRIDELEVLVLKFKEEQSRIEDGILSALDRLNQFEDALETTIAEGSKRKSSSPAKEKVNQEENDPEELLPAEEQNAEAGELDIF